MSEYTPAELVDMLTNGNALGDSRLFNSHEWKVREAALEDDGSTELDLIRDEDDKKLTLKIHPSNFPQPIDGIEEKFTSPMLFRISIAMQEFTGMVGLDRFANGEIVTLIQRQPQLPSIEPEVGPGHWRA